MIRVALSADVGHGESTGSFVVLRDAGGNMLHNSEIKPLNVQNNAPKIYSTLTYKNGYAIIGGAPDASVNAFFKRSPEEWDNVDPKTGKKYKEMMKDFIGCLVESLLNKDVNPQIGNYSKDEIVLFVGCPSDKTWINPKSRKEYEKLISEATGIKEVNVVAESTAAIFSIIGNNASKKINPKDGVAVFDFGSSTADFTYISLGKVLAEMSWTLGASAIEANIVDKLLYDELGLEPDEVWDGDLILRQLTARDDIKEAWFGDTTSPGHEKTDPDGVDKSITYYLCDEYGNPKTRTNKNGVEIPKPETETFILDRAFMENVISEMPIREVKCKGQPVEGSEGCSWYEICYKFMTRCYNLMINNKLECRTIVLTGGASRMKFIADICKDVFKNLNVNIFCDEYPSYCVSNGLCQIAINKSRLESVIAQEKNNVKKEVQKVKGDYISLMEDKLTDYIFDSTIKIVGSLPNGITVGELKRKVESHFKADLTESKIKELISGPCENMKSSLTNCVINAGINAAKQFYSSEIGRDCFALDTDVVKKIDMGSINVGGSIIEADDVIGQITKIISGLLGAIVGIVVYAILAVIPIIGPIVAVLAGLLFDDWMRNNPNQRLNNIDSVVTRLNNKKTDIKGKIRDSAARNIATNVADSQFKDIDALIEEWINNAVRIVALEQFAKEIRE